MIEPYGRRCSAIGMLLTRTISRSSMKSTAKMPCLSIRNRASAQLGVRAQLIMCFLRDLPAKNAMATLLESLPYRDLIIGVGLDSDERGNPPSKFAAVFARARQEDYRLTMHCDVNQQDSTAHIRQCLELIGVERIDHGVNAKGRPQREPHGHGHQDRQQERHDDLQMNRSGGCDSAVWHRVSRLTGILGPQLQSSR